MDVQKGEDWIVHRFLRKPGGLTMGSTTRRLERGGTRAGPQCTTAGIFPDTGTGDLGLERFGRGEGDYYRVTKHHVRAGGGTGVGAPSPTASKC